MLVTVPAAGCFVRCGVKPSATLSFSVRQQRLECDYPHRIPEGVKHRGNEVFSQLGLYSSPREADWPTETGVSTLD